MSQPVAGNPNIASVAAAPSTRSLALAFVAGASFIGMACATLAIYSFELYVLGWRLAGAFRVAAVIVLATSALCGLGFGVTLRGLRKRAWRFTSTWPRLAAAGSGGSAFLIALGVHFVLPTSILLSLAVFTIVGVVAAFAFGRLYLK